MSPPGAVALEVRDLIIPVHPGLTVHVPHLDVMRGRATALLGRSASGKSTLLRQLGRVEGGYFRPGAPMASGRIVAHALQQGADEAPELMALSPKKLQLKAIHGPGIGFVFQQDGLFPDRDALGNVRWGLEAHRIPEPALRAAEALAAVGLAPERQVATLSGGERKRLALARALALGPRILLLDEPFTGLDPESLQGLHTVILAELARGATVVLVTHQREDVSRLADDLVFLDNGRVTLSGARTHLESELAAFFDAGRLARPP